MAKSAGKGLINRERINKMLQRDMQNHRILYWRANTGWGKTITLQQYFAHTKQDYISLDAADEQLMNQLQMAVGQGFEHILIDNLNLMEEETYEDFYEVLDHIPKAVRLYLLGRAWLPSYLKKYEITNELVCYDTRQLAFETEEAAELLKAYQIPYHEKLLGQMIELSQGWIVLLIFLAKRAENQETLDERIIELTKLDLFDYFDHQLWSLWESDITNFLLNIGHLQHFTEKEACLVCGKHDVSQVISHIMHISSILIQDDETSYHFQEPFAHYLRKKQKQLYEEATIRRRYENTALYFSMENDLPNAMKYYSFAGDRQKMTEILIENANGLLGDAFYYELEKYYLKLDEESICQSPEMMKAMAMMHSISLRIDESNYYVKLLREFEQKLPASDPRKKTAKVQLAYLQIALPHQGNTHFIEKLIELSKAKQQLSQINITGDMPSIMSGGMDFCVWSKNDRLLYQTLKLPMSIVFGKASEGLPEIAFGESLFEKCANGNFTESLMLLNMGRTAAEISQNMQMQFAANSIVANIFLTEGSYASAKDMMERYHEKVSRTGKRQLPLNSEAFLIWMHMLNGESEVADAWLAERAPNENEHFFVLERYRYIIKVKAYIIQKMYLEAQSLLDRLEQYFNLYERYYNMIEVRLMRSIILFRSENESYLQVLEKGIEDAYQYEFYHVITGYGIAILPLLAEYRKKCRITRRNDKAYLNYVDQLFKNVKKQAELYPQYLEPKESLDLNLTKSELKVLHAMTMGLSNQEIADQLNISISTVKTHAQNIYIKLEVKNRVAAVRIAKESGLV